ncbi:MAG: type I-A CRISPR-associated protein Cas7/Csa2 [Candidatus Caldarchaeum sp.]|nr:type I-A CRISPR-associated protein Cas7/Csa2 [Candidatus Caldarchaeum sp.]MDW8436166.1 type I-A CRISPR-associated protein Cas7/Csa2 [Candidatus Caldarchaeum sp.]
MFISIGVRFLCNVEALNMVESIGNLSKHRKAPIVVPIGNGFKLLYVPAISGESIGHAYQQALVDETLAFYGDNAPVDEWCKRGEFIKFGDRKHMTTPLLKIIDEVKSNKKEEEIAEAKHRVEKEAIISSIVADVGGFLIAEGAPVKRTSCFQVGYAIPVFDALDSTAIESQFHVRYMASETVESKSQQQKEKKDTDKEGNGGEQPSKQEERKGQAIYYVEIASAVYGLTFNINLDMIGRTSMVKVEEVVNDRFDRVKVALAAASRLFTSKGFGAKRSRYLPVEDTLTIVAAVAAKRPFVVSPPQYPNFAEETYTRAVAMNQMLQRFNASQNISITGFSKERPLPDGIQKAGSVEEVFIKLFDKVMSSKP